MKKIAMGLISLGLSATAFAGAVEYQEPEAPGRFMIGVEALYVQVGQDDFIYGYQGGTFDSVGVLNTQVGSALVKRPNVGTSDYEWGWHADIGYAMPGDGPDIVLGWTHIDTDDSNTSQGVNGSPFAFIGPFNGFAHASSSAEYTDVDLLLGKEFLFENRYHVHPFFGARYANIETNDKAAFYNVVNTVASQVGNVRIHNDFSGVGPRLGMDIAVELGSGFALTARGAGSILIGEHDFKYTANRNNAALHAANAALLTQASFNLENSNEDMTVPELDYRIGLNYAYEFSPETSIGAEIGWQATQYVDVVDKSNRYLLDSRNSMSDWSFQGPYFRLEVDIA